MYKISRITQKETVNTSTGEIYEDDYKYVITLSDVNNPFKRIIEVVRESEFSEEEIYIGRIIDLSLIQKIKILFGISLFSSN